MVKYYNSKNALDAGNQQERSKIEGWITGFVDGEGCFSVSIIKNNTTKSGWQIFPEFIITQGEKSLKALKMIKNYFKCGNIFINNRYDNHNENLYRFCVRSINDLKEKIIPFFLKNKLLTLKRKDFKLFSEIIDIMLEKKHLQEKGFIEIARKIEQMNRKKPSRFLKSSETTRQTPPRRGRYSPNSMAT